ncbi:hypothetical protein C8Q74DRAFT_1372497 [Fomes fomentarius]|nr:hypothetical protein C8Q74DRAFT_1372497 [Fomes fomentarius]
MNQTHLLASDLCRDTHGSLTSSWTGTSTRELELEDIFFDSNNVRVSHTTDTVRSTDSDGTHGYYAGLLGFEATCDKLVRRELEAQYLAQNISYPQPAPFLDYKSLSTELGAAAVGCNQRYHTQTPSCDYNVDIPVSVDALSEEFGRVLARPSYNGTWLGIQEAVLRV